MAVEVKETLINGRWRIKLPKHRAEREQWNLNKGGWEVERLAAIREHVRPGDQFIYCGNEEGDMSGLIASWGACMILIEPNVNVWPNSKLIWDVNNLKKPGACFVGFSSDVTDLKGTEVSYQDFPECANGEVISNHGFCELHLQSDVIPQITLDYLCDNYIICPNHISIDVEGSAFKILKGAEKTLRYFMPNLYISFHPEIKFNYYGLYLNDVRKWVKDLGYHERLLSYNHEAQFIYTRA